VQKRSDRMRKVCRLTESEEATECRAMGQAQQHLEKEVARLEELQAYRESYRAERQAPRRVSSLQWQDYQAFLQRLDQAIALQTQAVMDGKQARDLHRRRWMAKRRKLESLERMVQKFCDEETTERERVLQKATDEQAQHGVFRQPGRA
jgi:flagellar protein FliJ